MPGKHWAEEEHEEPVWPGVIPPVEPLPLLLLEHAGPSPIAPVARKVRALMLRARFIILT
jgi:hypothetical protein